MVIDSHMHANSLVVSDLNSVINNVNNSNSIESVINVGLNIETSQEAIIIAKNNKKFSAAIGIHPLYIGNEDYKKLYELAQEEKVVAIGEIGIDSTKDNIIRQKKYLIEQIIIANNLHLPVIIHSNNANKIVIEIFEKYVKPKYGCVFHCFQPDLEDLQYIVKNGYYISFAGRITYKNAHKSIEVAKSVPNNLFLIETDSPYISPEPVRTETNKPDNIKYIVKRLSEIMNTSVEEVERISLNNTKRLFKKIG